jgi:hypothetical protein
MKNLYLVGELVGGQAARASERASERARELPASVHFVVFIFHTRSHARPGLLYLPFMHLITNNVGD